MDCTIDVQHLYTLKACSDGIRWFKRRYGSYTCVSKLVVHLTETGHYEWLMWFFETDKHFELNRFLLEVLRYYSEEGTENAIVRAAKHALEHKGTYCHYPVPYIESDKAWGIVTSIENCNRMLHAEYVPCYNRGMMLSMFLRNYGINRFVRLCVDCYQWKVGVQK